jgi:hypothetical protein
MRRRYNSVLSLLLALLTAAQVLVPVSGWAQVQMRCPGMPAQAAPCAQRMVAADTASVEQAMRGMPCCCCHSRPCPASTQISGPGCNLTVRIYSQGSSLKAARAPIVPLAALTATLPSPAAVVLATSTASVPLPRFFSPAAGPLPSVHGLRAPPSA